MRFAVLVAGLISAAATAIIALLPELRSVYHWPALHITLETAAALIALLAAFLVVGRLRRHRLLNELVLVAGLAVLALSNLFFVTLPTLLAPGPRELTLWDSLTGSAVGALLFAAAAFAPRRRLEGRRLVLAAGLTGLIAAALLTGALIRILAARLPRGIAVAPPTPPSLHSYPAVSAVQLVMALLYGLAVAGFLRRSLQLGDEFLGWLAIAAVLATASRINYCLYPALDSGSAYVAEVFRLCFYAVLLMGSIREIQSYWQALSEMAVFEERRRIARDLHDGLAQELAYLARNLDSLGRDADPQTLRRLRRAVERAQLESRRAIYAFTAPGNQALAVALAEAAGEVARRYLIAADLEFADGIRLPAAREEALIRIACEAVSNAARHSGADRVHLRLIRDRSRVRLQVRDTGCGFESGRQGEGYGLISMRERASSVGADLRISSAPGGGTEVEVTL